ncbi:MAG: hypothetical protein ACQESN_11245 [Thermotogota bacterium]
MKKEHEIEKKLEEIKSFYTKIQAYYSVDSELIENQDSDNSLKQLLNDHLEKNQEKYNNLLTNMKKNQEKVDETLRRSQEIEDLYDKIFSSRNSSNTLYHRITQVVNESNIKNLENKVQMIKENWEDITKKEHNGLTPVEDIKDSHQHIIQLYNDLFDDDLNSTDKTSKARKIENEYEKIKEFHTRLFEKNHVGELSKAEEIDQLFEEFTKQQEEITSFHKRLFTNEENTPSIDAALKSRIEKLEKIEIKAKRVINLSSDAGLAGGFYQNARKARKNKQSSQKVFYWSLGVLAAFNLLMFFLSNWSLDFETTIVKGIYSVPLIWIAVVANMNINKYSRLEAEYSHKESLAKSYERYKTEIEKLEPKRVKDSEELLVKLLNVNLNALEINPALTMDKAKNDLEQVSKIDRPS